ncbi:MAG: CoB--CoM heterodisulfide reductase iron-sulfur subunit A family protein [Desulfobulbaceae bacterium]|nr:CoB--CoM heterodisulfide reductase iron-sulfur subunit A family protein [Desulfobulbaceae bacterium]
MEDLLVSRITPKQENEDRIGSVLVVGSGIGGMQAALDLANSGLMVHMINDEPSIGGTMSRLDKTFPTGDCAMCMISPRMVESSRHPNIKMHTMATVASVSGHEGNFTATIEQKARYVDPERCTGCGDCEPKCPVKVFNVFNQGLDKRKAVYALFPQAVPNTRAIDPAHCLYLTKNVCRKCEKVCEADAINFEDKDTMIDVQVGSIILTPGLKTYQPEIRQEFGYGKLQNVVTSLQFERLLSASGPCSGTVARPSDGGHPKRLAWIQCVGSRNGHNGNPWCSSVCCMYAAKQSIIANEHDNEVQSTIYYMELRAFGKDFDKYIEKAKNDAGVIYKRAMVAEIVEDPETKNLLIHSVDDDGKLVKEEFDMVILSIGFEPREDAAEFSKIFGIATDEYGFAQTSKLQPVETSRKGVYVAGTYQGPKDIPETVIQASGAAAGAMALLGDRRGTEVEEVILPDEVDIEGEEPKIGVIVCHCGTNIAGTVDVHKVAEVAANEPGVAHSETIIYACAPDGQQKIRDLIKEKGLNRVVVASCTPRTHAPLFQDTIREVGLNKFLFELADIREQCSWCHMHDNENATSKAIEIVNMNIAKTRRLVPVTTSSVGVNHTALVVGGGIAGMTASLSLTAQGYGVHLVERSDALGGLLRNVRANLEGDDVQTFLADVIQKVENNSAITLHMGTFVEKVDGFVGNFETTFANEENIAHGALLIASGGEEYSPVEYDYAESDKIITQRELENLLADKGPEDDKCYVMVQCVGSREEPSNYCSRICCQDALKNSIAIKEKAPEAQVVVIYRDMRAYGLKEDYYRRARDLGVLFFLYTPDEKPQVEIAGDKVKVTLAGKVLGREMAIDADYLVLSTGLRPQADCDDFAKKFKLTCNIDGFLLEAHVKLRPVDFPSEGFFLAGLAHAPKNLEETISQSLAAAGRVGALLSNDSLSVSGVISKHNRDICMSCLACVKKCPFGAPFIDEDGRVSHNEVKCTGCGICAGVCPAKAYQVNYFRDDQLLAMIDSVTEIK